MLMDGYKTNALLTNSSCESQLLGIGGGKVKEQGWVWGTIPNVFKGLGFNAQGKLKKSGGQNRNLDATEKELLPATSSFVIWLSNVFVYFLKALGSL